MLRPAFSGTLSVCSAINSARTFVIQDGSLEVHVGGQSTLSKTLQRWDSTRSG